MQITLIFFIKLYKYAVSPFLPAACRFTPTCSEYAVDAIKGYGMIKGIWLSVKRILRCHPFGSHCHDPVPVNIKKN